MSLNIGQIRDKLKTLISISNLFESKEIKQTYLDTEIGEFLNDSNDWLNKTGDELYNFTSKLEENENRQYFGRSPQWGRSCFQDELDDLYLKTYANYYRNNDIEGQKKTYAKIEYLIGWKYRDDEHLKFNIYQLIMNASLSQINTLLH